MKKVMQKTAAIHRIKREAPMNENEAKCSALVIGIQASAYLNQNQAAATDEVFHLTQKLLENFGNNGKDPSLLQGDVFEFIEVIKINRKLELANRGKDGFLVQNAEGLPHAKADIVPKNGKGPNYQAKSSSKSRWVAKAGAKEDYNDMRILTNPEHVEPVKDIAQESQRLQTPHAKQLDSAAKRTVGELKRGKISSGGTSHDEAMEAARDVPGYVQKERLGDLVREAGANAIASGLIAAVSAAMFSTIKNAGKDNPNAMREIAIDSAKGGVAGAATGAMGTAYRVTGKKLKDSAKSQLAEVLGSHLQKSNVAMAIASLTISTGVAIWSWANQEIDTEATLTDLGRNGTSCAFEIFIGASAGMVFGPLGAAVGSMAGYIGAACVYNSLISVLRSAKLADEEAKKIRDACEAAVAEMERRQQEFKEAMAMALGEKQSDFNDILGRMDFHAERDPLTACRNLVEMATFFNVKLRFANFEEFDDFMTNSQEPLKI
jgi:hypothetical protein